MFPKRGKELLTPHESNASYLGATRQGIQLLVLLSEWRQAIERVNDQSHVG